MALKEYKPTSAARRHMTVSDFAEITKTKPEKKLTVTMKRSGGRNNHGHITTRHIGGGHKRRYRIIDWRRDQDGVPAKVAAILAPIGVNVGDTLVSGDAVDVRPGNAMPVKSVPVGTVIHNLEAQPGSGAKMIRTAGSFGQLMAKEGKYAQVRMPSGEVRQVLIDCKAVIGQLSNIENSSIRVGKAGKSRWRGIRPTVRGLAMNPVDHPHGGGEGKSGQGNPHPVSPWGQKTKGLKTRNNRRTDKFIVSRRKPGIRNTPQ
jgi:large subunit ribosomal protein L2